MRKSESRRIADQIHNALIRDGIASAHVGKKYTDIFNTLRMYHPYADITVDESYTLTISMASMDKARKLVLSAIRHGIEVAYVGKDHENLVRRVRQAGDERRADLSITVSSSYIMTIKHNRR